jgi:hypothetical protein
MKHQQEQTLFYRDVIVHKNQAFCHLLLFFSLYEDETFRGEETYQVYTILQSYAFTAEVNFPEEVNLFFDYKNSIGDEQAYFKFITDMIDTTAPNVILFHAAQVALSDAVYSFGDKRYLELLRTVLNLKEEEGNAILQLVSDQRMLKIKGNF